MAKKTPNSRPGWMTVSQAANLLMLTERRIQQLAAAGNFPKAEGGLYAMAPTIRGYITFLKDEARKNTQSEAHAELQRERALLVRQRRMREEKELCYVKEALDCVDEICGRLKIEMGVVPSRVAWRDIELRRKIETELENAFQRATDHFEKVAAELRGEQSAALTSAGEGAL